jgi:hypothetical protein
MSNFTASIVASIVFVSTGFALAPNANATPTGQDRLVSSYVNPTQSTKKVETALAKIQGLLEINCSKNFKKQATCDKAKFSNQILVAIRKSKDLRTTLATIAGVNKTNVNASQLREIKLYQQILLFQNGNGTGNLSQEAQQLLESFDLIDVD